MRLMSLTVTVTPPVTVTAACRCGDAAKAVTVTTAGLRVGGVITSSLTTSAHGDGGAPG